MTAAVMPWCERLPRRGAPSSVAGLRDRWTAMKAGPKIMGTFRLLEFWSLSESAGLVGTEAKADIRSIPMCVAITLPGLAWLAGTVVSALPRRHRRRRLV